MIACGLGAGVGGVRLLQAGAERSVGQVSGCCARKAKAPPCCSGGVADCCVVEKSDRSMPLPALPVPPTVHPLLEWVPTVVEHLELPDLALVRWAPAVSWVDEGFVVPVPLFLRDRVFRI